MRPISVCMPVATTTARARPYVAAVPLKIMLCRSPSAASPDDDSGILRHGNAFARQRGLGSLQSDGLNHARVGGDRVAFLDQDDVAGHHLRGRHRSLLATAYDTRLRSRHLTQRGDRRFGSRLLDVTHHRVEQHNRADGNRFVWQRRLALVQPQTGRDGGGGQQQNDEDVLKLLEKLFPRGHRRVSGQFISAFSIEARTRFRFGQAALWIGAESCENFFRGLLVRRSVRSGHVVNSLAERAFKAAFAQGWSGLPAEPQRS